MCGIAGIKGKVEGRNFCLGAMLDSMYARGPDGCRQYYDEDVVLGHRRLKIIDLSSQADQPLQNEDDTVFVIGNGEIYNFKELRAQLQELGHRFKSNTDTEVIVHGYEAWGIECVQKMKGMFAFAIWDRKTRELFLVRDRFGIKPLYYYCEKGIFLFASQVRAILVTGLVPKTLNPKAISSYLSFGGVTDPLTMINGIYSLKPAHYLAMKGTAFTIERYWNPALSPGATMNPDEASGKIHSLLGESVQMHLVSDVPLGIFLSGGVDSACLLSLAAKKVRNIKTISLVFKERQLSEARYSRLLAKKYATDHREVLITPDEVLRLLPEMITTMDEPTFDGINTYMISRVAKKAGLTVVLSGLGGDEVFAGYPNFRRIARLLWFCGVWQAIPEPLREGLTHLATGIMPLSPRKDKITALCKCGATVEDVYFLMRMLFSEAQKGALLREAVPFAEEKTEGYRSPDIVNQFSWLEINNYMRNILLRDTDCMSMAHSLEVRVPFLDHELVEYVLSVPGAYKVAGGVNKPLLIKSLGESLPGVVFKRSKMGFVFPFEFWMKANLKAEVAATLLKKDNALDEYIAPSAVARIWNGFLKGHLYWQRPWSLYVLKKWVNANIQ